MIVSIRRLAFTLVLATLAVDIANASRTVASSLLATNASSNIRNATEVPNHTNSTAREVSQFTSLRNKFRSVQAPRLVQANLNNTSSVNGTAVLKFLQLDAVNMQRSDFFHVTSLLIMGLIAVILSLSFVDYQVAKSSAEWRPLYLELKSHAGELKIQFDKKRASDTSAAPSDMPSRGLERCVSLGRNVKPNFWGNPELFMKIPFNNLVDEIGVSALCVLDMKQPGLSGLPKKVTVLLLAGQTWALQGVLLYFMYRQLLNSFSDDDHAHMIYQGHVPLLGIVVAIFLHILRVLSPMPLCLTMLKHLQDIHDNWIDYSVALFVFIMETVILDSCAIVIGGMLLCTSRDIVNAVLLTCELVIVCDISSYVMALNSKMNRLGGTVKEIVVCVPARHGLVRVLNLVLVIIPIVPIAMSVSLCYIGLNVLHMPVLHGF